MTPERLRRLVDEPDNIDYLPWNLWHRSVLADGADPELARLGRAVLRGSYLSHWPRENRYLSCCNLMTRLVHEAPDTARRLWQLMLETEGLAWTAAETDEQEPISLLYPHPTPVRKREANAIPVS